MCLVYLDCKLRQDSYACFIFKLKYRKRPEKNIFRAKKRIKKGALLFLDTKVLTER